MPGTYCCTVLRISLVSAFPRSESTKYPAINTSTTAKDVINKSICSLALLFFTISDNSMAIATAMVM